MSKDARSKTNDVRIVELEKFSYVSFSAISNQPEMEALHKLDEWKGKSGFIETQQTRSFGFNNPMPEEGNPVYGYEIWLTVEADDQFDDIEVKIFDGGLYAVATATAGNPEKDIPLMWENLNKLIQQSKYEMGDNQWLEEFLPPDEQNEEFKLDLYFPIK